MGSVTGETTFRPSLRAQRVGQLNLLVDPSARSRGVLVAFTDRRGGVSPAPYDSLNFSDKTGDSPPSAVVNRRLAAAAIGFDPSALVVADQVHGTRVIEVEQGSSGVAGEGDALVARGPGPVLGILTADCVPAVIAGEQGVAAVHAGWRGLVAGILEASVAAVAPVWGAWVGPSIHACCYEVGDDVIDAFRSRGLPVAGQGRVDPGRAAAFALHRAGVAHVAASWQCTSCEHDFFSYRRDGMTGRQGAFAALFDSEPR